MAADFPYTDEQVDRFAVAADGALGFGETIPLLRRLHAAGITVTFPEPRFYTHFTPDGIGDFCDVVDRSQGSTIARFYSDVHPDARCAAQAEADRLNGGAA